MLNTLSFLWDGYVMGAEDLHPIIIMSPFGMRFDPHSMSSVNFDHGVIYDASLIYLHRYPNPPSVRTGDIHFTFIQHRPTTTPQEPDTSALDAEEETEDDESGSEDSDEPIDWEPEQPPPAPAPTPNPAFPASNYLGRPLQVNQGTTHTASAAQGTLTPPPEIPTAPASPILVDEQPLPSPTQPTTNRHSRAHRLARYYLLGIPWMRFHA
jgi:hypothetical protein